MHSFRVAGAERTGLPPDRGVVLAEEPMPPPTAQALPLKDKRTKTRI